MGRSEIYVLGVGAKGRTNKSSYPVYCRIFSKLEERVHCNYPTLDLSKIYNKKKSKLENIHYKQITTVNEIFIFYGY